MNSMNKKEKPKHSIHPRKSLGQHFLKDKKVVERIISASHLTPSDIIIEVGPGRGVLTGELAKQAGQVIAVELDSNLISLLNKSFKNKQNINIINADILKTDITQLLKHNSNEETFSKYKVIANLPYYITSPILRYFLEGMLKPSLMVVMVQKEIGENITAQPGNMSLLSIGIQLYGKPEFIVHVPAASFYPKPKVDSVVLSIKPYSQPPIKVDTTEHFFKIARAGFSQPRKQLRNSLSNGLSIAPEDIAAILKKAEIDPRRRAETLSLEEWAKISVTVPRLPSPSKRPISNKHKT
ncbi:MAG: ribosomal RNA small subunit methyltransferase A [Dehalococcoidia bacterium]|nr:ribosomal RNA small subunit methyltransferase A [Dehalococcoidia bacterium]